MSHPPDVRVFDDLDSLSAAAAALFTEACASAVAERGRALVALSGGSTPAGLYSLLARPPYLHQVDWPRLHVFWGDERLVPPTDPQSNYRQAYDAFLSRVPIPDANIHRVPVELPPSGAAQAYALTIKQFADSPLLWPRLDLVLLGMGDDGHTASLFPGSPVDLTVPAVAVTGDYQGRPANRVTLTPPVFNAARRVLFLVSGQSKSQSLAHVLYGSYQPDRLPAQRIRPTDGELIWLVDRAAASRSTAAKD
ncbi:MAG: 6-phosphogluconolactonase [Anaerolineae bacterium]